MYCPTDFHMVQSGSMYKQNWDLELLYKNENDPEIEKDLKCIEKVCDKFERKYKKSNFIKTPESLTQALDDINDVIKKLKSNKPLIYFSLRSDTNSNDKVAIARMTQYEQRITVATNKLTFFDLAIAKIPKSSQKKYLQHKVLQKYSYMLKHIFDESQYNLTEQEEQLKSLLSQTSYTMWVDAQEKLLTQQSIIHKGKTLTLSQVMGRISDVGRIERQELSKKLNKKLKSVSYFAGAEVNAVYNYKKIMDERRGYKNPYSATVLRYEHDEKTVEALVSIVTKYFKISHRFYKLQARLLKQKKLTMADRSAQIGNINEKFTFPRSINIVRETFLNIGERYVNIFDTFLKNGQIDVFPKKGKKSGAYCCGANELPTFLLLNHADNIHSVGTLAHEMGHAIHAELSRKQPLWYRGHTIVTAEVASTFFEQAVLDSIQNKLSKKEKIIFLHNKLLNDISTIFRQVACFNFELDLHKQIRSKGQISASDIAMCMQKHLKSYVGSAIDVIQDDGYYFVTWSHIRAFFYVYSYAFGQLVSRVLYENWKKDNTYIKKVEQFLSAGKSKSPYEIFKSIGIDTSNPKFFEDGLKSIEQDIKYLEKLSHSV